MRIMLVGATGTIGSAVTEALRQAGHDVVRVGRTGGDLQADLADPASLGNLYDEVGLVDAVVSTAGLARFGPFEELTEDDYLFSLRNKLMGNVNLIRLGIGHVRQGGSFTITTGNLTHQPAPDGAIASLVGGALESYVKAAAFELAGRYRVNAVSPGALKETLASLGLDPSAGISATELAGNYVQVVEGNATGTVIEP